MGDGLARVEEEKEREAPRRFENERVRDFNQRLLKYYTQELPRAERYKFSGVAEMQRMLPHTKDLLKIAPVPRPGGLPRP